MKITKEDIYYVIGYFICGIILVYCGSNFNKGIIYSIVYYLIIAGILISITAPMAKVLKPTEQSFMAGPFAASFIASIVIFSMFFYFDVSGIVISTIGLKSLIKSVIEIGINIIIGTIAFTVLISTLYCITQNNEKKKILGKQVMEVIGFTVIVLIVMFFSYIYINIINTGSVILLKVVAFIVSWGVVYPVFSLGKAIQYFEKKPISILKRNKKSNRSRR